MKTRLITGLVLVNALASSAVDHSTPTPNPPVVISGRITVSAENLASLALEKPLAVAEGIRITHMGVGRFDQTPPPAETGTDADLTPPRPALSFTPANEIPFTPGNFFGWVVRFDTNRNNLTLTEEFVLPAPITISGGSGATVVSDDGKTATSPRDFPALWDWTYNFWGLEEGDPVGDHEFGVFLGETEIARFKFKIIEP